MYISPGKKVECHHMILFEVLFKKGEKYIQQHRLQLNCTFKFA